MPKIKYLGPPRVEVNELAALFTAYRRARKMSSADIAREIGCSPSNARCQMNKPGEDWNIGQLVKYCDVLGIPYEQALAAAAKKAAPRVAARESGSRNKFNRAHCSRKEQKWQQQPRETPSATGA